MPLSMIDIEGDDDGPQTLTEAFQQWLIAGAVLTIPALVTLIIFAFILNFISSTLDPIVGVVSQNTQAGTQSGPLIKLLAVVTLMVVTVLVGIVADQLPTQGRIADRFHAAMESLPAVGSVYKGFRQMGEVVVESDADSFREVKLVEFPTEGSYTLAFVTADTPANIETATGSGDMVTVFMPMAPNPVMGGHVLHVDRDRIVDIDLTVEEGIQSIVTSGVTVGGEDRSHSLSADEIAAIGQAGTVGRRYGDDTEPVYEPRRVAPDREAEYDRSVDPHHADTPERIVERERTKHRNGENDEEMQRPMELADRDPDQRDDTEARPAERRRERSRTDDDDGDGTEE